MTTVLDINAILKKTDKAIKHLLCEEPPSHREYLPTAYDCCLTQQILNSDATRSMLASVKTEMELEIKSDVSTRIKADVDLSLVEKRRFIMTDEGAKWLKRAAKDILDSNEKTSQLLLKVLKRARQGKSDGLMDEIPTGDVPSEDDVPTEDGSGAGDESGVEDGGVDRNASDDDGMGAAWGDGLTEECCDEEDAELMEVLKRYKVRNDEEDIESEGDARPTALGKTDDDDEELDDDAFDSNLGDEELDQLYQ
ncbi:hypothetical protein GNI_050350 [Gregarina niphandrodes]|uniref:Uncharacterized protein n=1 Tax=Gregarina niphandrodes TaxID=110365 RepID=A0A023B9H4_GRENI|nr:hypothetical protein GNI_050350 [Gregarina niphandrodes]EZG72876.1 hypothetical protein GNI_050350 [Gregarina niphandrodes]|eukprot:XP_011129735.1 hypothetical protein GNI_050350 [Gregarina niphandrodes]